MGCEACCLAQHVTKLTVLCLLVCVTARPRMCVDVRRLLAYTKSCPPISAFAWCQSSGKPVCGSLASSPPYPLPPPPPPHTHTHTTELETNDGQGATSLADEALGEIAETGRVQCVLHACMYTNRDEGSGQGCPAAKHSQNSGKRGRLYF